MVVLESYLLAIYIYVYVYVYGYIKNGNKEALRV